MEIQTVVAGSVTVVAIFMVAFFGYMDRQIKHLQEGMKSFRDEMVEVRATVNSRLYALRTDLDNLKHDHKEVRDGLKKISS